MDDAGPPAGEHPLSAREKAIWHALKTMGGQGLASIGSAIERAAGLSGADFAILSRLQELGSGELTQGQLVVSLGWDKTRVSHQLSRMEGRALVSRSLAEVGRGVTVRCTSAGWEGLRRARPAHARAVRENILAHVSAEEAEVLLRVSARMATAARPGREDRREAEAVCKRATSNGADPA